MIKSVLLKKAIKGTISPIFSFINKLIPKDDRIIMLYSANDGVVFCNKTLRRYLLDNGYDRKYKIICGINNMKFSEDISHVSFVSGLSALWFFLRSAHVFYTAGQIPIKPNKKQCVINMQHGNADIKKMGKGTKIGNGDEFFFTYLIVPSDFYIKLDAEAYGCDESNIVVAGDPLCDELLTAPQNVYDFSRFKKMLLWVPTFRQSEYLGYNDSSLDTLVPLFNDVDYSELNDFLAQYNIHLIAKLHPAQKVPEGLQRHLSHLCLYSHKEFCEANYDMYTLMAQSDGLIGDYSSASMQYLLLDRPMAFVVPDIEEYGKTRGFVFDHPEDYMGGHIIKTKEQFFQFIEDFAKGKDEYKEKRHWICDQIYKYKDANSCQRIVKLSGLTLD